MNPCKILVVDDDTAVREGLIEFFSEQGAEARGAMHGLDALEQLGQGFLPDVVVMDLMMPVMNGWDLREALRKKKEWAKIPILVASAAGAETPAALRVEGILHKPLNLDHLRSYVDQAVSKSRRVRPVVAKEAKSNS